MTGLRRIPPACRLHVRFWRDDRGVTAVEFSIVAWPFFIWILFILQLGIYYLTQASLDAGVVKTAESLRANFNATTTTLPSASSLKSLIVANSGGLVPTRISVEIRPLASLSGASVPITDGTIDYGSNTSVLVLRAQSSVMAFAPGFSSLTKAMSGAVVRRQGR